MRQIETDKFPFEFISQLAERESWRKEIHRPVSYLHKWWAKRLGSVFRGILLGCALQEDADIKSEFYALHDFSEMAVFDPFMGSGITIGEAHKLGFSVLGRDINPVAVESVRVAFGLMDQEKIANTFAQLSHSVGEKIRALYRSMDSKGRLCDVLYYFWVMQAFCPSCSHSVDLFSSWIIAKNAYPDRKPIVQLLCPFCGEIFPGFHREELAKCRACGSKFMPGKGTVKGAKAECSHCKKTFKIIDALAVSRTRPGYRLYGKLILNQDGGKEYLPATEFDHASYTLCSQQLQEEINGGSILLPKLSLEEGYNTKQALNYGFRQWRDFFNDRQLLSLGWLCNAIIKLPDKTTKDLFLILFSGILEFNNLFASYKGEGTGAVRHMFSHHVLKPERTPIEANVWGTPKSSGSFSNLFRSRLKRAISYRNAPTEVNINSGESVIGASLPFSGKIESQWPLNGKFTSHAIYLSCGDSSRSGLPEKSLDLIVTDPPFFDNVHYSELADFFYAWQQLGSNGKGTSATTRSQFEVQNSNPEAFAEKLKKVFLECNRILKDDGLLVFTYHHSRDEGWDAIAKAIFESGFIVGNAHPVKSEMSVAVPKSQAKEPIQLDIILVCHKTTLPERFKPITTDMALNSARAKIQRLSKAGFKLSLNDEKIILFGQLLTTFNSINEAEYLTNLVNGELAQNLNG